MIYSLEYELQDQLHAVEELCSDSKEIRYTAFKTYKTLEQVRAASNKVLEQAGGWTCNHEHDCCGCWGMVEMEVAQIAEHAFILVENWRQDI